jgi:restriction system protein
MQVDARGEQRSVWVFEMRRLHVGELVPVEHERSLFQAGLREAQADPNFDNSPVVPTLAKAVTKVTHNLEETRRKMLALTPQEFEHLVKSALERSGFDKVHVTRYSQDGGIDVEAETGFGLWALRGTLLQVQAKRWMHTVGRREIAELRGSLKNYARGLFVTTSHYSKSAVQEAGALTKAPIVLMDGQAFAEVTEQLDLLS